MTIGFGILVIVVIAGIVLILMPPPVHAPTTPSPVSNAVAKADLIVADTPKAGSAISSPLTILGRARGNWYFEASFPYELKDAQGNTLAQGPVQAQGEWMTSDFVPFSTIITFPSQPAGSKGTLILKKDNPSGLPENEDQLVIPITF